MNHSGKSIRRDEATRKAVFLTMLSTYMDDPINLFMKGPSSIGKTYVIKKMIDYFPEEDVWSLGGASPTAFIHEQGELIDEYGEVIPTDENELSDLTEEELKDIKERMKKAKYVVRLENKIVIFLDAPHVETYNKLRTILSHDRKQITFKFADRSKGAKRIVTRTVYIYGWPSTIFADSSVSYIQDLVTRGFTITPEMTVEKYKEALEVIGEEEAYPEAPDAELEELRKIVLEFKERAMKMKVKIPFGPQMSKIYPSDMPRDMRDFKRFCSLVKVIAMLNAEQRPKAVVNGKEYVLANMDDLREAMNVFSKMEMTTRTGLPGDVLEFYDKVLVPLRTKEVVYFSDILPKYHEVYNRSITKNLLQMRHIKLLLEAGLIDRLSDEEYETKNIDKRLAAFKIMKPNMDSVMERLDLHTIFPLDKVKSWYSTACNKVNCQVELFGPDGRAISIDELYNLL
jgi:hypothetical protein